MSEEQQDKQIIDNAPEGYISDLSFDITGRYFDKFGNLLNSKGVWANCDDTPQRPRSLSDIRELVALRDEVIEKDKRIAELEVESKRDVAIYEQIIKDQRDTICLFMPSSQDALDNLKQRDLEMQAKGTFDSCNNALEKITIPEMSALRAEYFKAGITALAYAIDREAEKLRNQAKGGE